MEIIYFAIMFAESLYSRVVQFHGELESPKRAVGLLWIDFIKLILRKLIRLFHIILVPRPPPLLNDKSHNIWKNAEKNEELKQR